MKFYLFHRSLHPELFTIHRQQIIRKPRYEATVWIAGSTHVVTVCVRGKCLTELTAPDEQPLPTKGLIEAIPMRGERSRACSWSNGLTYMMNAQVEQLSPTAYDRCHADLLAFGRKRGMLVTFEQPGQGGAAPFSLVEIEARPQELHISAYHAFPDESVLIKTQSLFECRPRPPH